MRQLLLIAFLIFGALMTAFAADSNQSFTAEDSVRKLAGDMKFTEGPVWTSADGGYLVFSDIDANELKKWTEKDGVTTFRKPSHNANGNTLDRHGSIVTCEHSTRRVTRTMSAGHLEAQAVIADRFEGKRFNSPNDVVVKSDGTIWFTDPNYGLPRDEKPELDGHYVFRVNNPDSLTRDPDPHPIKKVAEGFDQPNGLCFSPDEKQLYIADSGKPHHIRVFDVSPSGELQNDRVFCVIDNGVPDGIRCDDHGNIWSSAGDGVHVFSPDGKLLQRIKVPETPANLCFGGQDGKTVFITARTSLYAIKTKVRGAVTH